MVPQEQRHKQPRFKRIRARIAVLGLSGAVEGRWRPESRRWGFLGRNTLLRADFGHDESSYMNAVFRSAQ